MQKKMQKVQTLLEALPFIQEFSNQIVVIKYGGSAQVKEELKAKFAQDILLLNLVGLKPVIVHGGGKSITTLLDALGVKSEFKNGSFSERCANNLAVYAAAFLVLSKAVFCLDNVSVLSVRKMIF